jgi:hypothetical protein
MDEGDPRCHRPFGSALSLWRAIPGGTDVDGNVVGLPDEAVKALWILQQCERFGKLPEEILGADSLLQQLLAIEAEVRGDE